MEPKAFTINEFGHATYLLIALAFNTILMKIASWLSRLWDCIFNSNFERNMPAITHNHVYGAIYDLHHDILTKDDNLGVVNVPILFFDSVDASGFDSIYDGADQYAGNPNSMEFFGVLALGYLRNYAKKYKDTLGLEADKYLKSFLHANTAFHRRGYMECTYYAFIPGKIGGRLVLHLAEGSYFVQKAMK